MNLSLADTDWQPGTVGFSRRKTGGAVIGQLGHIISQRLPGLHDMKSGVITAATISPSAQFVAIATS